MSLTILRANPLEFEFGLKTLMTVHGYHAFPAFFDRGYLAAVQDGSESWLGVDENGTVQMNVTAFVHQFTLDGTTVRGGMLGNMMAATQYRTFFPMVALLRRLVADLTASQSLDFVYGDPGPETARAVFRGARITHVGDLDRFVLPIGDEKLWRAIGARLYCTILRARAGWRNSGVTGTLANSRQAGTHTLPDGPKSRLIPLHTPELYSRRLPEYPSSADRWIEMRRGAISEPSAAAALVRGPVDPGRVLAVNVLRRAPGVPVRSFVPTLARVGRGLGAQRIQVETLRESDLARELVSAGFRPRGDVVPIFAHAFTTAGRETLRRVADWEVTAVDMER